MTLWNVKGYLTIPSRILSRMVTPCRGFFRSGSSRTKIGVRLCWGTECASTPSRSPRVESHRYGSTSARYPIVGAAIGARTQARALPYAVNSSETPGEDLHDDAARKDKVVSWGRRNRPSPCRAGQPFARVPIDRRNAIGRPYSRANGDPI